tara:strand:+ start:659 stop:835 length:177 start_codon:yes stop_codon:yes gene_type:complete
MDLKRKKEIEKYWLQTNRMHRDLKYMKYDTELNLEYEMAEALKHISKIKAELDRLLKL